MSAPATPSARNDAASASPGGIGCSGSYPRRSTYSCPSGNRSATRCAQCTASAVFPTPAVPDTAEITTADVFADPASSPSSRVSSSARPVKPYTSDGSCCGAGTTGAAGASAGGAAAAAGAAGGGTDEASRRHRDSHAAASPPHASTYASVTASDGRLCPLAALQRVVAE
jgi:hypothetical protein